MGAIVEKTKQKREIVLMSENKDSGVNTNSTGTQQKGQNLALILGIVGGIITIIGFIVGIVVAVIVPITQHTGEISEIKSTLAVIRADIKEVSGDLKYLSEFVYTNSGNPAEYSKENISNEPKKLQFAEGYKPKTETTSNEPELENTQWEKLVYTEENGESNYIAEDEEGNKYIPPDLCNVDFITAYVEGGKEVYFSGRYNENNRWSGKCILNVYNGNELESILEAIYNDGKLYSYKRVSDEKDGTWKVVNKIDKEDYKIGETWIYRKEDAYQKNVSLDTYTKSQILSYEDLLYLEDLEDEELLSYYNGKTSDGYYNEDEEKSYLIKYFKKDEIEFGDNKRVIKTLYKGNFVNGEFKEKFDKSWYITREADTAYMYYEGSFSKGTADHKMEKEFRNPAGYKYIEEKLKDEGLERYLTEFLIDY